MSQYCEEVADVYNERRVKARKLHQCCACRDPISPGHHYWRIAIVFDGTVDTFKRCGRCQALHKYLRGICEALGEDDWPDERLACGHSYEERWGEEPPPEIAALAFALPGEL